MNGACHDDDETPDGIGRAATDCGDRCEMRVWVRGERIARCEFRIEGCANTLAAATVTAALARDATLGTALGVKAPDVLARIAGLPAGTEHVADLAVAALHDAVLDAFRCRQEPWKRTYRTR